MKKLSPPKILEKISYLFPMIQMLLVLLALLYFLLKPNMFSAFLMIASIYLLPLLVFNLINLIYPLSEGNSYIGIKEKNGSAWIIAYNLQNFFISFSIFERVLILIPGLFSLWLRAWGSSIGKNVLWTPRVDIVDRTSLDIGDYTFIGDKVYLSAHIIMRKENRLQLLHKRIKVGDKALVGFSSHLGPGTEIASQLMLPALSRCFMGKNTITLKKEADEQN